MASQNFTNLASHLANASIDFSSVTIKALLINETIPSEANLDAWVDRADVTNEHAISGNYVAGGFACTRVLEALDTGNNKISVTITPTNTPVFSNATISSKGAIIYVSTGVEANDLLIGWVDFGSTITSTNGDYTVTFTDTLDIMV